mgnify:CR=1 FL=1
MKGSEHKTVSSDPEEDVEIMEDIEDIDRSLEPLGLWDAEEKIKKMRTYLKRSAWWYFDYDYSHKAYLETKYWKDLAQRRRKMDNFQCQNCGCDDSVLEVHHNSYFNKWQGEKELKDTITLCHDCHHSVPNCPFKWSEKDSKYEDFYEELRKKWIRKP